MAEDTAGVYGSIDWTKAAEITTEAAMEYDKHIAAMWDAHMKDEMEKMIEEKMRWTVTPPMRIDPLILAVAQPPSRLDETIRIIGPFESEAHLSDYIFVMNSEGWSVARLPHTYPANSKELSELRAEIVSKSAGFVTIEELEKAAKVRGYYHVPRGAKIMGGGGGGGSHVPPPSERLIAIEHKDDHTVHVYEDATGRRSYYKFDKLAAAETVPVEYDPETGRPK